MALVVFILPKPVSLIALTKVDMLFSLAGKRPLQNVGQFTTLVGAAYRSLVKVSSYPLLVRAAIAQGQGGADRTKPCAIRRYLSHSRGYNALVIVPSSRQSPGFI